MRIHVYAVCYNEQTLIPYFLRHYALFADAITIFDNESTDETINIIEAFKKTCTIPITIVSYNTNNTFSDTRNLQLKNMTLNLSKGKDDWIIVVDIDELICHEEIRNVLESLEDFDVIHPQAYHMIGNGIPTTSGQIYSEITGGVFDSYHSKPCIINTHRINKLSFDAGAHHLETGGGQVLNWSENDIKLLHYKWIDVDYVINNYRRNASRLSEENIQRGWGFHYRWDEKQIREEYNSRLEQAKRVI